MSYNEYYSISPVNFGFYAMIQNIVFVVLGLSSIGLALGLRMGLPSPRNRYLKLGVWSLVIFGLGILFSGLLPLIGVTLNYLVHVPYNLFSAIAFAVTFIAYIAAQMLIVKGLKDEDTVIWGKYRRYTRGSGFLFIILLILLTLAIIYSFYPGVSERVFIILTWIWIFITGVKLYLISINRKPILNRWI
jgi:hypothetical protein